ncbi:type I-E CRISPR-associated protein Cas5/CasD [Amycolatopsis sp. FDAARGOS 1241]|uniref:type I-E CRISPR-associated protein Cas5/CasD n=1 Tax=Amycolatopsis sp. FDAARGOS 1241 TaxID=2778070 RepID=UPI00194FD0F3|nr:type I-E CRISPR-associated protein Cas5/CasD [Amycolatopsis sp. FDAARGOS 1241]QRP46030.1 type I-E CRISPR-associated protein Cas5/CasD [Amycolatopsis sp. FDAARGOS 1241]
MSALALRLAGPMQAWGSGSRFVRRTTETAPTKSGIIGLVAAALGVRRTDPLEDLLQLRFGVRIDQPGELMRDFQTAQRPRHDRSGNLTWQSLPLSTRYYIADAVFLAILEGDRELVEGIDAAIRAPEFQLYLGRRSCPPVGPITLGVSDDTLDIALETLPWQASERVQKKHRDRVVHLAVVRDAAPDEPAQESFRDTPVSFDPNRRQYAWRSIVRDTVQVTNPHGTSEPLPEHDPMALLGGETCS